MKIAVWHNLPSGGGKRALFDHVSGLVKRGHEVVSWRPSSADPNYLQLSSLIEENVLKCFYYDIQPKNRFDNIVKLIGHYLNIYSLRKNAKENARIINNDNYEVLFANTCKFMASPFIGSYVNIPAVLYLQEPKRSIYEATPFNPIALPDMPENVKDIPMYLSKMIEDVFQHRYFRIKARNEIKNARSFGKILVNSYFSRESVLRSYGINSEICYLGVDKIKFKRKKGAQRKRNVLTVGSVIPAKNISFIIGSISHMKKPWPILTIVSNYVNDKYYNYIMGMSSRLGVKIEMYRDISDELLIEKYSEATALAYSPRLEPFGYIPLEAGACSLPIVAVAEGGIRETVVNGVNGLLVDGNQEEMAEALSSLINDPKKAAKFGKAGREIVENNWSLDDAVERLEIKLESMM